MDMSSILAPAAAGLVASIVGVFSMFPIVAASAFGCYVAGDFAVQRWRGRVRKTREAKLVS